MNTIATNTTATNNNVATIDSKKPTSKGELIATNINLLIEQLEAGQSDAWCVLVQGLFE